jgi:hypothetical protein
MSIATFAESKERGARSVARAQTFGEQRRLLRRGRHALAVYGVNV